jgi:Holliday junction DNA helicase RuvA
MDGGMIGKLKGIVDEIALDHLVVDVGGVGYVAFCGSRTLSSMPAVGEPVVLYIETYVREDTLRLYGFSTTSEREWFRLLQNVQGVGSKVALAVLGTLTIGELASAIALQDKASISRAPGVGPKVAARIAAELKDKIPALGTMPGQEGLAIVPPKGGAAADAVSALVNLGYRSDQAAIAVAAAAKNAVDDPSVAVLIRLGLRELSGVAR